MTQPVLMNPTSKKTPVVTAAKGDAAGAGVAVVKGSATQRRKILAAGGTALPSLGKRGGAGK